MLPAYDANILRPLLKKTRLDACANLRSIRPGNRKATWIASWYVDPSYSATLSITQQQPS